MNFGEIKTQYIHIEGDNIEIPLDFLMDKKVAAAFINNDEVNTTTDCYIDLQVNLDYIKPDYIERLFSKFTGDKPTLIIVGNGRRFAIAMV